jgi:NADH-quinone oxidoreductase subunit F
MPGEDLNFVNETVERLGRKPGALIPMLQALQEYHGFLPREALERLAELTGIRPSDISGVSSFYDMFRHKPAGKHILRVCRGTACQAAGAERVEEALRRQFGIPAGADTDPALEFTVEQAACVGCCALAPVVQMGDWTMGSASAEKAGGQVRAHLARQAAAETVKSAEEMEPPPGLFRGAERLWTGLLDDLLLDAAQPQPQAVRFSISRRDPAVRAFLENQVHVATEHPGRLDPLGLDRYLANDGFAALRRCVEKTDEKNGPCLSPEQLLSLIEKSGLRGRGGAGFPSGQKWRAVQRQPGDVKYVICNSDWLTILESFPFRVIEGLALAAVAVGAHEGFFYVRREYPLAARRLRTALAELEKRGWLGDKLLGGGHPLRLSVVEGAGALVCGEETGLIAALEGRRGTPRLRPPFPAESGLWGKPTLVNNAETLALVPWIVRHGAEQFAALGTARCSGTKVFALAGSIRRNGTIEVPMGTTLRRIIEDIGGGAAEGRRIKAVQIGGPSGGCVPARLMDIRVDYESFHQAGAIMGSGGMVVMDDTACMVDSARSSLRFTQGQSCGRCTFCRVGTKRMLDILDRLCAGKAQRSHLEELERLARQIAAGSLCGLGKTAPNPVLTTLRYFRDEYEAHLQGRCPAGRCAAIVKYSVNDGCTGCTLCAQHCPVHAIPMTPYAKHEINPDLCTRCDTCRKVCPQSAIEVT